jgi:hypothetical protein
MGADIRAMWRHAFSNYRRTSRGAYIMANGIADGMAWAAQLRALSASDRRFRSPLPVYRHKQEQHA